MFILIIWNPPQQTAHTTLGEEATKEGLVHLFLSFLTHLWKGRGPVGILLLYLSQWRSGCVCVTAFSWLGMVSRVELLEWIFCWGWLCKVSIVYNQSVHAWGSFTSLKKTFSFCNFNYKSLLSKEGQPPHPLQDGFSDFHDVNHLMRFREDLPLGRTGISVFISNHFSTFLPTQFYIIIGHRSFLVSK